MRGRTVEFVKRWGSMASTVWVLAFMTLGSLGTGFDAFSAERHWVYAGEIALTVVAVPYLLRSWREYRALRAEASHHGPSHAA